MEAGFADSFERAPPPRRNAARGVACLSGHTAAMRGRSTHGWALICVCNDRRGAFVAGCLRFWPPPPAQRRMAAPRACRACWMPAAGAGSHLVTCPRGSMGHLLVAVLKLWRTPLSPYRRRPLRPRRRRPPLPSPRQRPRRLWRRRLLRSLKSLLRSLRRRRSRRLPLSRLPWRRRRPRPRARRLRRRSRRRTPPFVTWSPMCSRASTCVARTPAGSRRRDRAAARHPARRCSGAARPTRVSPPSFRPRSVDQLPARHRLRPPSPRPAAPLPRAAPAARPGARSHRGFIGPAV